jgi:hypothetical protein
MSLPTRGCLLAGKIRPSDRMMKYRSARNLIVTQTVDCNDCHHLPVDRHAQHPSNAGRIRGP